MCDCTQQQMKKVQLHEAVRDFLNLSDQYEKFPTPIPSTGNTAAMCERELGELFRSRFVTGYLAVHFCASHQKELWQARVHRNVCSQRSFLSGSTWSRRLVKQKSPLPTVTTSGLAKSIKRASRRIPRSNVSHSRTGRVVSASAYETIASCVMVNGGLSNRLHSSGEQQPKQRKGRQATVGFVPHSGGVKCL